MEPRLHAEIVARLTEEFGFKPREAWLQQGKCPSCGKKEMFASAAHPWVLRCGRTNKCGAEIHIKEVYPELFASWSDRYKPTAENPHASADAYLKSARGFELERIAGWYSQEHFWSAENQIGSATVRFPLAGDAWWERIIDRPERFGVQKANFRGRYGGTWWQPPTLTDIPDELWIVEGIFNAISLLHHGIAAVSAMSSGNYPSAALKALAERCQAEGRQRPALVWAFDEGRAGRKSGRKFVTRSREEGWTATAALVPGEGGKEPDWNDMHLRGRLEAAHLEDYRYHGALMLAASAQEKALLMHRRRGWQSFSFEYDNTLQWFSLDIERYQKAHSLLQDDESLSNEQKRDRAMLESHTVAEIANCHPTALYFQANKVTDESWYYFRIDFPHDGPAVKNTFTACQLTSPAEFKKRLLAVAAGSLFTGTSGQLDAMLKQWLGRIKTVETVDYVGYAKEHQTYVLGEVAIKDGKLHRLNDEDFFDIGRLALKSLSRSVALAINPEPREFDTSWLPLLWECHHHRGIAALAFWLGTLFAEQIRARWQSYPFMELVGEPGSGKSTLIEFLWRLCGRIDYEGFDPVKATLAARSRNFSQVSNLPVVLIEGDRTEEDHVKQRSFAWEELKPLYNGRSIYSRGVKNAGNETYEPPFRGAIVIAQNAPVSAHEAVIQRILHVEFDLSTHTAESELAADKLWRVPVERLSGFIVRACQAEAKVLATLAERIPHWKEQIVALTGIRNKRIVDNHAQLAALVEALPHVVPLGSEERRQTLAFVEEMAQERQEAINADHPIVQEFWDIYDYLNGEDETPVLNHARRGDDLIAVSLNHFMQVATDRRQQVPALHDLKGVLKTSRHRKFRGVKAVNSIIHAEYNARKHAADPAKPATLKCWIFQPPSFKPSARR